MTKKYNREKVLYVANSDRFNLSITESLSVNKGFKETDLQVIIPKLLKQNLIVEVSRDDSDIYYQTTSSGDIELLRLQIEFRKKAGKDITDHVSEYEFLVMESKKS